ncbi:MAG: hypothetical protein CK532_07025 [Flavobacteriales bacterium]|nr:MAG: hypothetical protein CK532_07025 [Flavobacteriales bacterium]
MTTTENANRNFVSNLTLTSEKKAGCKKPIRLLFIDNQDSFTFNLLHYLTIAGAEVKVLRSENIFPLPSDNAVHNNTENPIQKKELLPEDMGQSESRNRALEDRFEAEEIQFDAIMEGVDAWVIGPGPGRPHHFPIVGSALKKWGGKKPVLGICLGHQAIGLHCGWDLVHALVPMHGKASTITHNTKGIFQDLPNPLWVGRYHSLVLVDQKKEYNRVNDNLKELRVDALCEGEIMALSDLDNTMWGLQFHPESVLTFHGQEILSRWLNMVKVMVGRG